MRQEAGALDQGADATEDRRAGSDRVSGDVDGARVGPDEAEHHAHRRRLAGTVGAEQADDLAALGAPRDVIDGTMPIGIRLDQVRDDERHLGEVFAEGESSPAPSGPPGARTEPREQRDEGAGEQPGFGVPLPGNRNRCPDGRGHGEGGREGNDVRSRVA